jgi:proteic killer suppression protein
MIRSFAHKGLELFYRKGSTKGIQAQHARRLRLILGLLDAARLARIFHRPTERGSHVMQYA